MDSCNFKGCDIQSNQQCLSTIFTLFNSFETPILHLIEQFDEKKFEPYNITNEINNCIKLIEQQQDDTIESSWLNSLEPIKNNYKIRKDLNDTYQQSFFTIKPIVKNVEAEFKKLSQIREEEYIMDKAMKDASLRNGKVPSKFEVIDLSADEKRKSFNVVEFEEMRKKEENTFKFSNMDPTIEFENIIKKQVEIKNINESVRINKQEILTYLKSLKEKYEKHYNPKIITNCIETVKNYCNEIYSNSESIVQSYLLQLYKNTIQNLVSKINSIRVFNNNTKQLNDLSTSLNLLLKCYVKRHDEYLKIIDRNKLSDKMNYLNSVVKIYDTINDGLSLFRDLNNHKTFTCSMPYGDNIKDNKATEQFVLTEPTNKEILVAITKTNNTSVNGTTDPFQLTGMLKDFSIESCALSDKSDMGCLQNNIWLPFTTTDNLFQSYIDVEKQLNPTKLYVANPLDNHIHIVQQKLNSVQNYTYNDNSSNADMAVDNNIHIDRHLEVNDIKTFIEYVTKELIDDVKQISPESKSSDIQFNNICQFIESNNDAVMKKAWENIMTIQSVLHNENKYPPNIDNIFNPTQKLKVNNIFLISMRAECNAFYHSIYANSIYNINKAMLLDILDKIHAKYEKLQQITDYSNTINYLFKDIQLMVDGLKSTIKNYGIFVNNKNAIRDISLICDELTKITKQFKLETLEEKLNLTPIIETKENSTMEQQVETEMNNIIRHIKFVFSLINKNGITNFNGLCSCCFSNKINPSTPKTVICKKHTETLCDLCIKKFTNAEHQICLFCLGKPKIQENIKSNPWYFHSIQKNNVTDPRIVPNLDIREAPVIQCIPIFPWNQPC